MKRAYRAPSGGGRGFTTFPSIRSISFFSRDAQTSYLIFCEDSVMHLDEWVFNTEAHPFMMTRDVSTLSQKRALDIVQS